MTRRQQNASFSSDPGKIAVLFPGLGYTCDKPLLYYSGKLCLKLGYRVIPVPYTGFPKNIKGDARKMREAFFSAMRQTELLLKDVDWGLYDDILFIGKSIGTTVAAMFAKEHNLSVRCIHFTPLEETFSYTSTQIQILAFHGTSDPWARTEKITAACEEQKIPLYLTEYANHSLETGEIMTDIQNLLVTMERVESFISEADKISTSVGGSSKTSSSRWESNLLPR